MMADEFTERRRVQPIQKVLTRLFAQTHGREPRSQDELSSWLRSNLHAIMETPEYGEATKEFIRLGGSADDDEIIDEQHADIEARINRALDEYHRLLPTDPEARIAILVSQLDKEGLAIFHRTNWGRR